MSAPQSHRPFTFFPNNPISTDFNTDKNTEIHIIYIIFKMQDTDTHIYILYNYKLYKLTINIYVYKYVSDFLE